MKNFVILFLSALLAIPSYLSAQEGPQASSGIGIIAIPKNIRPLTVNFPMTRIELFSASGEHAGVLFRRDIMNLMYLAEGSSAAYRISNSDMAEIKLSGFCLKVYERRGDYVKVLAHTAAPGYWLALSELDFLGFKAVSWMDVLLAKSTQLYIAVDVGINLRAEPDQKSKKIILVKGRKYLINLTGKTSGMWAEAQVFRHNKHMTAGNLPDAKPLEEWTGWMKIIDDAGYPNLWFFPETFK
jgi:hypothetical protein